MGVLGTGDPRERHLLEVRDEFAGARGQRHHVAVLDLPTPRHLLDHQLRVHAHGHRRRAQRGGRVQPGDQTAVLGNVVRRPTDPLGPLSQNALVVRIEDDRAIPCDTRVAT
ncbi:MAG: hypothetical protein L0H59_10535 [Tomitella sp.]|nr:hypothetical protein [Tomitella sp.]